jgi:putative copper resistance protein D
MIDRPELLWTDAYGLALLVKIILFGAMLMVAAHNRATLTPALAQPATPGRNRAVDRLWIASAIEITLGIVVIAIVAWLGITVPGAGAEHMH